MDHSLLKQAAEVAKSDPAKAYEMVEAADSSVGAIPNPVLLKRTSLSSVKKYKTTVNSTEKDVSELARVISRLPGRAVTADFLDNAAVFLKKAGDLLEKTEEHLSDR